MCKMSGKHFEKAKLWNKFEKLKLIKGEGTYKDCNNLRILDLLTKLTQYYQKVTVVAII